MGGTRGHSVNRGKGGTEHKYRRQLRKLVSRNLRGGTVDVLSGLCSASKHKAQGSNPAPPLKKKKKRAETGMMVTRDGREMGERVTPNTCSAVAKSQNGE
jgi:hypothetical protein